MIVGGSKSPKQELKNQKQIPLQSWSTCENQSMWGNLESMHIHLLEKDHEQGLFRSL